MTVLSEDPPTKQASSSTPHYYRANYKSKSPFKNETPAEEMVAQQAIEGHFLSRKFFDQFKVQMVQTQQKN